MLKTATISTRLGLIGLTGWLGLLRLTLAEWPRRPYRVRAARPCLIALCFLTLTCAACAGGERAQVAVFALEGPPLAIAGARGDLEFEGQMDRGGMVGSGHFVLTELASGATCQGEINSAPGYRGRVRGLVSCGELRFLLLVMSNQGPDQGVGVGRFAYGTEVNDERNNDAASNGYGDDSGASNAREEHTASRIENGDSATDTSGDSGNNDTAAQIIAVPGLELEEGEPLLFYYHPWIDEARRRLADVQENVSINLQRKAELENNR